MATHDHLHVATERLRERITELIEIYNFLERTNPCNVGKYKFWKSAHLACEEHLDTNTNEENHHE